jgi:hypothetical protein
MSAVPFTFRELHCDHVCDHKPCEGCSRRYRGRTGDTNVEVRRAARREGWAYVPGHPASPQPTGRDYCPTHKRDGAA